MPAAASCSEELTARRAGKIRDDPPEVAPSVSSFRVAAAKLFSGSRLRFCPHPTVFNYTMKYSAQFPTLLVGGSVLSE